MTALLDPDEAMLAAHVRGVIAGFRQAVAPGLRAALDAFLSTRSLDIDADPLRNFTRTAQPVVHLPVWTARAAIARGARLPGGSLEAAVEAAVFGYLCAQVEDDGLEDRLGSPAVWVLLSHALLVRHQAALVSSAGAEPAFWRRYADRWLRYAGAVSTLGGAGLERGAERATALDRTGPLILPAAALLTRTGQIDLLDRLEDMVRGSTDAAQLFDDLLDAPEDLRNGRMTYVVRSMGGEQGAEALRRRLYLEGGFDAVLDEALEALARATSAASALDMLDAVQAFTADAARMGAARRDLLDALGEAIFGEVRPSC